MDGKAILAAAEYCQNTEHETCENCHVVDKCPFVESDPFVVAMRVLEVRDYILGEIRGWALIPGNLMETGREPFDAQVKQNLLAKLDSMKAR